MSESEALLCFCAAAGLTIMIYACLQYRIKKRWEEVRRLI